MLNLIRASARAGILLLVTLSCTNNTPTGPLPKPFYPVSGNPVVLRFGETKVLESDSLQITFDSLTEGRCPVGAVCFWEGMATIKLALVKASGTSHHVSISILGIEPQPENRFRLTLDTLGYRFTLLRLTPYPDVDSIYLNSQYIATLTVFPFVPMDSVDGEVIVTDDPPNSFLNDPYQLDSMSIDGDVVNVSISYSGGCQVHDFELLMTPSAFFESHPRQANLYLRHDDRDDPCDASLSGVLSFDLRPIAHLYELAYGEPDPIIINIHNLSGAPPYEKLAASYYPDPSYEPPPMFPIDIGDYWVYAETTWTAHDMTAGIDSIVVTDQHYDSLGEWWLLSNHLLSLGDTIAVVGDSIYTYQCCYDNGIDYSLYREKEYVPATDTPFTYNMILQGDLLYKRTVELLDTVIDVPAGSFAGCYAYTGLGFYIDLYQHILAPGVGFIYAESENDITQPLTPYRKHKMALLRYRIGGQTNSVR